MNKRIDVVCRWLLIIVSVAIVFAFFYYVPDKKVKQPQIQKQVKIIAESKTKVQAKKQEEEIKKYKTQLTVRQKELVNYVMKHSSPWVSHKHVGLPISIAKKIVLSAEKCKRPLLVLAIAQVESHFNPMAHSNSSVGICQINLINVKELKDHNIINSSSDLLIVDKNMASASYLISKLEKGRDLHKALQLYFGRCRTCRAYSVKVLQSLGNICLSLQ